MSESAPRIYARIAGTGRYLPSRVLTNAELAEFVDTSDEWIAARTGIRQRHVAAEGETTGDLAFHAAVRALEAAGVDASEIDLDSFPAVRASVVNFGVEALSGRRVADIDWQDLENALRDAIVAFEPRVLASTIQVSGITTASSLDHHNILSFEIRGQLIASPNILETGQRVEVPTGLHVETGSPLREEIEPAPEPATRPARAG